MVPKQKNTEISSQSIITAFPTLIKLFNIAEIYFFTCKMRMLSPLPVSQDFVGSNESGLVTALWKSSSAYPCSYIGNKICAFYSIGVQFYMLPLIDFDFRKEGIHLSLLFWCADEGPNCSLSLNIVSIS